LRNRRLQVRILPGVPPSHCSVPVSPSPLLSGRGMCRVRRVRRPAPLRRGVAMSGNDFLHLLASFEKRLATIADQAAETREPAHHTLERITGLRQDLPQLKARSLATADTGAHPVMRTPPPD